MSIMLFGFLLLPAYLPFISAALPSSTEAMQSSHATQTDTVESRLAALEAHNKLQDDRLLTLEADNRRLQEDNVQLKHLVQELKIQLNDQKRMNEKFLHRVYSGVASPAVGFHAQLSNGPGMHYKDQEVINMTYVLTNQGHAYNGTLGYFRMPYSGTYFLTANIITDASGNYCQNTSRAAAVMWVNFLPACFTDGHTSAREGESSTCTAIVHARAGHAAWLESIGEADFWYGSSFSGFLIARDDNDDDDDDDDDDSGNDLMPQ